MTAPDAFSFEEGPCIPADHAGSDLLPRCRGEGGDVSVLFWPTGWTSTPWTSVVQSAKAASRATSASRPLFRSVFDLRLALLYRKPDLAPVVVGCHVRAEVDLHVGLRCPLVARAGHPLGEDTVLQPLHRVGHRACAVEDRVRRGGNDALFHALRAGRARGGAHALDEIARLSGILHAFLTGDRTVTILGYRSVT